MPPNKEQRERLKGWLDFAEKHRGQLPHTLKRVWEPGGEVFEGCRNGTVEAHFHVGIGSGLLAVNPGYFCARLEATGQLSAPAEGAPRNHATDREVVVGEYASAEFAKVVGAGGLKLSVLVPNYEGVEKGEGVAVPSRTPLVGLVLLDDCPVFRENAPHSFPDLLPENATGPANRELRLGRASPMRFAPRADEVVGEVVERGPEVGEGVASDKAPLDGQRLDALDMERKEVTLAIELFPERVRWFSVEVFPSPDAVIEFVEVILCPFELAPAPLVEATHGV